MKFLWQERGKAVQAASNMKRWKQRPGLLGEARLGMLRTHSWGGCSEQRNSPQNKACKPVEVQERSPL